MANDNVQMLKELFSKQLGVDLVEVLDDLSYETNAKWTSIKHMELVSEIERTFDILLDTEEIIDLDSFNSARDILRKHDVSI